MSFQNRHFSCDIITLITFEFFHRQMRISPMFKQIIFTFPLEATVLIEDPRTEFSKPGDYWIECFVDPCSLQTLDRWPLTLAASWSGSRCIARCFVKKYLLSAMKSQSLHFSFRFPFCGIITSPIISFPARLRTSVDVLLEISPRFISWTSIICVVGEHTVGV